MNYIAGNGDILPPERVIEKLFHGEFGPETPLRPEAENEFSPLRTTAFATVFPEAIRHFRRLGFRLICDYCGIAASCLLLLAGLVMGAAVPGHRCLHTSEEEVVFSAIGAELSMLAAIAATVFLIAFLRHCWQLMPIPKDGIRPTARVLLLLLPVYCLVWSFRVLPPLATLEPALAGKRRRWLRGGLLLLAATWWLFPIFAVFGLACLSSGTAPQAFLISLIFALLPFVGIVLLIDGLRRGRALAAALNQAAVAGATAASETTTAAVARVVRLRRRHRAVGDGLLIGVIAAGLALWLGAELLLQHRIGEFFRSIDAPADPPAAGSGGRVGEIEEEELPPDDGPYQNLKLIGRAEKAIRAGADSAVLTAQLHELAAEERRRRQRHVEDVTRDVWGWYPILRADGGALPLGKDQQKFGMLAAAGLRLPGLIAQRFFVLRYCERDVRRVRSGWTLAATIEPWFSDPLVPFFGDYVFALWSFFDHWRWWGYSWEYAECRVAATGLAAELFRRSHGTFPPNAAALTPEFLAEVPLDPFSGRPIPIRHGAFRRLVRVDRNGWPEVADVHGIRITVAMPCYRLFAGTGQTLNFSVPLFDLPDPTP
jgi:hypothetical protein